MGTRTDEAERRLREQRALIEQKIDRLEQRAADDVDAARTRISQRVSGLPEALPGASLLIDEVSKHPFTTLAGAAGAGVALGLLSESIGGGNGHEQQAPSERGARADSHSDGGMSARALSALGATLLVPIQAQVQEIARDAIAGFSERARERGASPGGASAPRDGANGHGQADSDR